ncbi:MAG TPA: alpha/beta hydrolase [Gemmatimonadaceae bacterium]|nr:alpha/beta hydrolase [Gemmatimonadaceae bacterium]
MTRPLSPEEMYPAGHRSIATRMLSLRSGLGVRVLESGPSDGRTAVLLHGWGACSYSFRHALELLPNHGIRTIAVDLRGFGLSDKPTRRGQYTLDAYVADLEQVLDAIGVSRPTLIGHSMGGGIALHYALHRPERVERIALINPVGLVPLRLIGLARLSPRSLFRLLDGHLTPRTLIRFILRHIAYGRPSLVSDRVIDEYWAPTQLAGFGYAARATVSEFRWAPVDGHAAASLAVPCVVILGDSDRLVRDARSQARQLAGAAVHELSGGHCVHEEDPSRVYGIIENFVTNSPSIKSHNDLN